MHREIEDQEIIERYVRHQLAPEEQQAFEEHFFACEECFEKVQATERFIAGLDDAGSRGLLDDRRSADYLRVSSSWRSWMFPALVANFAALVACFAVLGWMLFVQTPQLRQRINHAAADAGAQRETIAALEKQVASSAQVEINVPLVMLQATRDGQSAPNEAALAPGAKHLTLWIELPSTAAGSFLLEIGTSDGRRVQTLKNLKRNSYGALVVSLPAEALNSGIYIVRLSRQEPSPVTLLAEYRLRIRKP